jgi:hypothetical protein
MENMCGVCHSQRILPSAIVGMAFSTSKARRAPSTLMGSLERAVNVLGAREICDTHYDGDFRISPSLQTRWGSGSGYIQ